MLCVQKPALASMEKKRSSFSDVGRYFKFDGGVPTVIVRLCYYIFAYFIKAYAK